MWLERFRYRKLLRHNDTQTTVVYIRVLNLGALVRSHPIQ